MLPGLRPCALILACLALISPVEAEEPTGLTLPQQIDLPTLITIVGEYTGTSIHFAAQKVTGNARIDIRAALSTDDAWSLLNQILYQHGYTSIVVGNPHIYHVVPLSEAEATSYVFTDMASIDSVSPPPGSITMIQSLNHIGPDVVIQALGATLGQRLQSRALGRESHQLVLAGERERVLAAIRLLSVLDRPGNSPALKTYQPRYASGPKLQRSAMAAWAASSKVEGRSNTLEIQILPDGQRLLVVGTEEEMPRALALLTEIDQAEPTITRTYRSDTFRLDDVSKLIQEVLDGAEDKRIKIINDRLTGGLIITASETQHAGIQQLLRDLSNAPANSRNVIRSFTIKHRQANDLAGVLRELTNSGLENIETPEAPDPKPAADGAAPAINGATGAAGTTSSLAITVDSFTNSLMILGPPRTLDQVATLIEQLDQRQPQVQIEATLVILNESESESLGVEWAGVITRGGTTLSVAQLFGLSQQGGDVTDRTISGNGLTSLIMNPGDYAALLQALQTVNHGRNTVTSMTVVDNSAEAKVNAVLQQPIANINSNTNVATTTYGGTSDAGTEISIKPVINAADQIQLVFSVSQSSFVGETITTDDGGVIPPPKRQDSISSTTTIPDGHIIALGGLSNQLKSKGSSGLPYLSRIPLLGAAFRNSTESESNSRFFLFIKADVLRHPLYEDLRYRSRAPARKAGLNPDSGPVPTPRFLD